MNALSHDHKRTVAIVAFAALVAALIGLAPAFAYGASESATPTNATDQASQTTATETASAAQSGKVMVPSAQYSAKDQDDLVAYVERLYRIVLDREPDQAGLSTHVNSLKSGMGAGQVAMAFFDSPEFKARNLSAEDQVERAYLTLLDRASDASGKATWLAHMNNGCSIAAVVKGFAQTPEFKSLCTQWGVTAGNVTVAEARDANLQATGFAARLYRIALNREPDTGGLNTQCQALLNGMCGAQLARGFFLSPEFKGRSLGNAEQVELLYQAMLDRTSDSSGLAFWTKYLEEGMTLDSVICGFSQATEFVKLCTSWGVSSAATTPTLSRDKSFSATQLVMEFYRCALGREASGSELDSWCDQLRSTSASEVAESIVLSQEFTNRGLSNSDKVTALYRSYLLRTPGSSELSSWVQNLDQGTSFEDVVYAFSDSAEFQARCEKAGLTWRRYCHDPYNGAYQFVTSDTPYFLLVDCNLHQVTVYEGSQGNWRTLAVWACGDGAPGMETVKGWFTIGIRGYYFDSEGARCFYYTQFYGDYLFHTVLYECDPVPTTVVDGRVGQAVSHGCVRLPVDQAKWIYDNVPYGTTVYVF